MAGLRMTLQTQRVLAAMLEDPLGQPLLPVAVPVDFWQAAGGAAHQALGEPVAPLEGILLQQGEQQRAHGHRLLPAPPHTGTSPVPATPHRGVIERTVWSSSRRACSAPVPVRW